MIHVQWKGVDGHRSWLGGGTYGPTWGNFENGSRCDRSSMRTTIKVSADLDFQGSGKKDKYLVLFPSTLLMLSVSNRLSAFIYEV